MLQTTELIRTAQSLILAVANDYQSDFGGGSISPSPYDTGWLARVRNQDRHLGLLFPESQLWLLDHQASSGAWSTPFPYDILPTISALIALLQSPDQSNQRVRQAATKAQSYLKDCVKNWQPATHESVGFEVLLPPLLQSLSKLGIDLAIPNFGDVVDLMQSKLIRSAGDLLTRGQSTLIHSLEAVGSGLGASTLSRLRAPSGHYGHSPAGTAAVLQQLGWDEQSVIWLRHNQARQGGAVPTVFSIDLFEAAWSLHFLLSVAPSLVNAAGSTRLLSRLEAGFNPRLGNSYCLDNYYPEDSDDTSLLLAVFALAGKATDPSVLLRFESKSSFVCWPDERNASISANAHVVEALALSANSARFIAQIDKATAFLLAVRKPDGSWTDKWHTSPYYAVYCAVRALMCHPSPSVRAEAIPSINWILKNKRATGGWGAWAATAEETAYAIHSLSMSKSPDAQAALKSGQEWLAEHYNDERPELWVGKQLYCPMRVVEAAILAALMIVC